MASATCVFCRGLGLRYTEKLGEARPCGCVFRRIFRACLERYQTCASNAQRIKPVTHEYYGGTRGLRSFGRRNEEFIADFEAISRRTLDAEEMDLLRLYFLQGLNWKACAERLKSNKGAIFHMVYSIEEKLGRAFRETEPYSIFPIDEYFSGIAYRKVPANLLRPQNEAQDPMQEVAARTNVIEMPRYNNRISRRFPSRPPKRLRSILPEDLAA